jgi:hypothetical protein
VVSEPVVSEPVVSEPVVSEPVGLELAVSGPAAPERVARQLAKIRPIAGIPSV